MSHIEVQAIRFSAALKKIWQIQQTHVNLVPHEKINQCLTNINQCLTDIFKIWPILTNI